MAVIRPRGTDSDSKGNLISEGNPILGVIGLVVAGIFIWALVSAARVTFAAIMLLLKGLGEGVAEVIIVNIVLNGLAGVLAAIGVEVLRQNARLVERHGGSFVSSLFQARLGESGFDAVFWGRVLIGGWIGLIAGCVVGSAGMLNFSQFLGGTAEAIIRDPTTPIVVLLGGGFGGPGGTGFFSLVFVILVIIVTALIVSLLAGWLVHLLMYGVAGMSKEATKAYVTHILRDERREESSQGDHPVLTGMTRGFFIGLTIGIIESVFTVLGIIKFYPT